MAFLNLNPHNVSKMTFHGKHSLKVTVSQQP